MSWRDRLLPASYRGVPFFVAQADDTGGRDVVVHQFPQRDQPLVEDVGRSLREYRIDAYVIGENYDLQLEDLRRACERPGLGYPVRVGSILVHPYRGPLEVICRGFDIRQTEDVGRFARLRLTFVEAPAAIRGERRRDPAAAAARAGASLEGGAAARAADGIDVAGLSSSVAEDLGARTFSLGQLLSGLDVFGGLARDAAAQARATQQMIANAAQLATSPLELVNAVQIGIAGVRASVGNALGALFAYEFILTGLDDDPVPSASDSPVERKIAANANLFAGLARGAAFSGALQAAVEVEWDTREEALERRSALLAHIDARLALAPDSEILELEGVRAALVRGVPDPSADLAELREVVLTASVPALVLAWRLYRDPEREAEIVRRGRVSRPLFLPVGTPLEVKSA